jgi:hypothetical protein
MIARRLLACGWLLVFSLARRLEIRINQLWDVVIVIGGIGLCILSTRKVDMLVGLCELAERRERVWTQLIEDSRYKFRQFLIFTVAVDRKGVCLDRGVD